MAYTDTWNSTFEARPQDVDNVSEGAERIRDTRIAIRERMSHDHYMNTAGTDADHGEHEKVTLRVQASDPAYEASKGHVYVKDVNSVVELFWRDEANNVVQMTEGGVVAYPLGIKDADGDTYVHTDNAGADSDVITCVAGDTLIATMDSVNKVKADIINELTDNTGVTVDGVLIKDGKLATNNSVIESNITDAAVTPAKVSFQEVVYTTSRVMNTIGTSMTALCYFPFKKQAGFNNVFAAFYISNSVSGKNARADINIGGIHTTDVIQGAGWDLEVSSAVSIASLTNGQWYTGEIRAYTDSGGTANLNGVTIMVKP